jgi:hypothetical protein
MRESQTGESLRLGRSMRRTWTQKRETRQVDVERNSAGKVQGDVIAVLRSVGDTLSRGACDDMRYVHYNREYLTFFIQPPGTAYWLLPPG